MVRGAVPLRGQFWRLWRMVESEAEWLEVVPQMSPPEAELAFSQWLAQQGLTLSDLGPGEVMHTIFRTVRGTEASYSVRRAVLHRLKRARR
jgi:hypothetical protein